MNPAEWVKEHKGAAIGAGAVVVVAAWWAYRHAAMNRAAASASAGSTVGALADPGAGGEYLVPYSGGGMTAEDLGGLFAGLRPSSTGANTIPAGPNNTAWLQQAVAYLASVGYEPIRAQQLLQKYFAGGTLTNSEAAEIGKAVKQIGLPPAGTPMPKIVYPAPALRAKFITSLASRPPQQWRRMTPTQRRNYRNGILTSLSLLGYTSAPNGGQWPFPITGPIAYPMTGPIPASPAPGTAAANLQPVP